MKLQVGDIFVQIGTNNIGLLVYKKEEYTCQYCIDWTSGAKSLYTKSQISYWVDEKKLIHYPVIK